MNNRLSDFNSYNNINMINKCNFKLFQFLILISILFFSFPLSAQNDNGKGFDVLMSDLKISLTDGLNVYSSPAKFDSRDWLKTGAVLLTTAAFIPFDKDIRNEFAKNHTKTKDKISDFGNAYGNAITPVVAGIGMYGYGLFSKDKYVRETGRMLLEAVLFASLLTDASKIIIGRSRPYTDRGPYFFKMFQFKSEFFSFPSGHSTVAFATSSVLANRINNTYISIGIYVFSSITALSRIYSDKHWASDVVIGSAIGYFVGDFISSNKKNSNKRTNISYSIQPVPGGLDFKLNF